MSLPVQPAASPSLARLLALGGELTPTVDGTPRRKYVLAHMQALVQALGAPSRAFRSVLIAGTNGKGSTAATLASILQAAGHRVGLYTSPHLVQPNERIRIDGIPITDAVLAAYFEQVEAAAARLVSDGALPYPPSFFETMTAIAFLQFAGGALARPSGQTTIGLPVDIAVLEVGLGGRLDATNVVDPIVSVLTDIAMDHTAWLGTTLTAITREKAGILRAGGSFVTLPQHPEANQAIGEVAVPLGVLPVNAADYLPMRTESVAPATTLQAALRNRYQLALPHDVLGGAMLTIDSPLAGGHQQRNIALALATAVELHRRHGYSLTPEAMEAGVRATVWPGRLQLLLPPPELAHHAPVLLDAAHNPAGAWALRAALSPLPIDGPRTLVFACMADKAIGELAQVLFPVFDEVLLTRAHGPRAATLEALTAAAEPTGTAYRTFPDAAAALEAAQLATPAHGLIVLAGSIALLGEMEKLLASWKGLEA